MARRRTQVDRKAAKAEQRREVRASPAEHPLLALQRSAGNSAVTESLLARDGTKTAPKEEPPKSGGSVKVTIDGIGTIDALSYTLPTDKSGKEVTVTAEQSKLSPRIMEYVAEGKHVDTVVLELGYVRVKLKDVYITGVHMSGTGHGDTPMETYTFSFGEIDMQFPDAISGA